MSKHYARFYKCDLQVQTPGDARNWDRNDPIRLASPRTELDLQEKARLFLRRCHDVELEVIAVSDHNFSDRSDPREWFLTHLIEQNKAVAADVQRDPIVIFPGFEVDIGYHLLCIFDPGTKLTGVSDCLTTLGLAPGNRFQNGGPAPLRFDSQSVPLVTLLRTIQDEGGGLVIAAHAFSSDGIANEGRDAADYQNENLLAVEVSQVPLTGRAEGILMGNCPAWTRKRRPAYLMSSDCKKLCGAAPDDTNYLGCRHTWIKMSKPSVVALRQAFLDQAHAMRENRPDESRIRFGAACPEDAATHPRIRSVQVRGATFLADQAHELSPNLNALIGGRGTGKSTLIEYLRLSLDRQDTIQGEMSRRNLDKLKMTLGPNGIVEVLIEKDARRWRIAYDLSQSVRVVEGDPIPDLGRFFPCRFLSQGEITEIAEDRQARSRLLDDLIRVRLDELAREGEDITCQIRALDEQILREPDLEQRKRILETERLTLEGRVERLKDLEVPLSTWKNWLAEAELLSQLEQEQCKLTTAVQEAIASSVSIVDVATEPGVALQPDGIRGVAANFATLIDAFKGRVRNALSDFQESASKLLQGDLVRAWEHDFEITRQSYEQLRSDLTSQATDPELYLDYQRQLKDRELAIAEVQAELDGLTTLAAQRNQQLDELQDVWQLEAQERERISEELTKAVPTTKQGQPFVQVSVARFGDDQAFAQRMEAIKRDRRRISVEDWGEFDDRRRAIAPEESLLAAVVTNTPPGTPAMRTLLSWLQDLDSGNKPDGFPWDLKDKRTNALLDCITPAIAAELALWRQPDRVQVELYRQDGTRAGELEQGLSVGQRSTAILALLLAQDDAPAILDQPEDDLDNEFVFRELVPLLRRVKETRQIVVATHNANIPVNADAELFIALEARDGLGKPLIVGEELAVGSLDRESVRVAAQEILEGSEEAFWRRHEKYGF
jgi:hypothetical protein